jgi:putative DNA primase/helicase
MNMIEPAALLAKPPRGKKKLSGIGDNELITEDAVALAFAHAHEGKLIYCKEMGKWFTWTGSIWREDKRDLAFSWARQLTRELAANEDDRGRTIAGKMSFAAGVEKGAKSDERLSVLLDELDKDPWLLGTPGGTVDLISGKMRDADPADRITKSTSVAPGETADCPLWLKFLSEAAQGDKDLIRFMQQWMGYSLTGITREQCFVFVYGGGGTGKGTFLDMATGILADYHEPAADETFTASQFDHHSTDVAGLRGARMVSTSETEEGRAWAENRIKKMTGEDLLKARFMRQDFFYYRPTFKIFVIGNNAPTLRNVDDAIGRRLNVIPFNQRPAQPDPHLRDKLKAEWPAILRWMIDGCLDWQANGLIRPDCVKAATNEYFAQQNMLGQFLEEKCDAELNNRSRLATRAELYAAWTAYAKAAGIDAGRTTDFCTKLRRAGFGETKIGGVRMWRGLSIKREKTKWND